MKDKENSQELLITVSEASMLSETVSQLMEDASAEIEKLDALVTPNDMKEVKKYREAIRAAGKVLSDLVARREDISSIIEMANQKMREPEVLLKSSITERKLLLKSFLKSLEGLPGKPKADLFNMVSQAITDSLDASVLQDKVVRVLADNTARLFEHPGASIGSVADVADLKAEINGWLSFKCGGDQRLLNQVTALATDRIATVEGDLNAWYMEALESAVGDRKTRDELAKMDLDTIQRKSLAVEIRKSMTEVLIECSHSGEVITGDVLSEERDRAIAKEFLGHLDSNQGMPPEAQDICYSCKDKAELLAAFELYLKEAPAVDLGAVSEWIQPALVYAKARKPEGFNGIVIDQNKKPKLLMDKAA